MPGLVTAVCVPEGGTVVGLKADALNEMFPSSTNADREAENVAAHIEGCEEELDDAQRVADTGLEDGGAVKLVPRWPNVKVPASAPAVYITAHGHNIRYITLSRCGKLCAVGSSSYRERHITVFDTTTADVVADFLHDSNSATMSVYCTAFSACGTWLATGSDDGTTVWLTSTWERVCSLDSNSEVSTAAWTHCGRLVSGDSSGKVRVRDLKGTPSATVLEGHSKAIESIAVSGTRIFSGSNDKTIRVRDISTLTHTRTLDGHTDVSSNISP